MMITDGLMILAVITGPILAVQVQKWIEAWRSSHDRKVHIFRVLMATRGTPMSPHHVEALNLIDIEFSAKKEREVRDSWKLYHDHLCECPLDFQDPTYSAKIEAWNIKNKEYLVDMLFAMSKVLGYNFDKVQLKKGAYTPKGHFDLENEQLLLRKGVLDVLYGRRGIPVMPLEKPDISLPEKREVK